MRLRSGLLGLCAAVAASVAPSAALAQGGEAPGAPGASANWTTGNKQGLGTSVGTASKVWYTLSGGALSEVYYPSGDTAQVRSLELAVTDGRTFVDRESEDTHQRVRLVDPRALVYEQVNTAKSGRYRITKTYVTDTRRSSMLIRVRFQALQPGDYRLFVLYDPAMSNSSLGDTASRTGAEGRVALLTSQGDTHAALMSANGFAATSSGFVGTSDGWTDLQDNRRLDFDYDTATDGNVLQTGELRVRSGVGRTTTHTLALAFGDSGAAAATTARDSLRAGFAGRAPAYRREWHRYLDSLGSAPSVLSRRLRTQYNVAVMTVKAHEDKTFRGAFIASLTLPWGFAVNADQGGGGYHFVWARDLYHQVTGLMAAGDRAAGERAVDWLFEHQQQPDGTFPQNSRVDGTPDQRNTQLDETAFPIILAYQLQRTDDRTWEGVRKAANALVRMGPSTPQERWEETGGYSPSTTAAEIAGLVAAARIARWRDDRARARLWLGVADEWQRNTERWMFTTTGPYGNGRYYLRINADTDPNDDDARDWGNAAGVHLENEVVDAGFLELVRLGVKAPGDPYVADSLPETDASLATDTPSGRVWHRYTFDGYGEKDTGEPWTFDTPGTEGRAWPLLSGERGEYEVANGRSGLPYLETMANTANEGYMIPEQVWDEESPAPAPYGYLPGKATGSASPLAWAMAQYIRLAQAIGAGRPVETPRAVRHRYASGREPHVAQLELTAPENGSIASSTAAVVRGTTDARRIYVGVGDDIQQIVPADGRFAATVDLGRGGNVITVVAWGPGGATAMKQVTVVAYGTRVGGLTDPVGDDHGPGSYVYPTCSCFNPGAFDLTQLDVYTDGDDVLFVARIAGELLNPFGGDQISLQRLNVYLGSAPDGSQPALPGTNMDTAEPWQAVVVGDGRFDQAGVYAPDGGKVAGAQLLAVPQTRQIAVVVPQSALGAIDPATALYGTAMFGNAEAGEGVGFIRPVYAFDYWNNPPAGMEWVKSFRFGGGAGEVNFGLASKDTDTRDPNAQDVIVGPGQSQADVLDWTAGSPMQLPMLPLQP
jgi:glucan 1,4-alpha-glucosidase